MNFVPMVLIPKEAWSDQLEFNFSLNLSILGGAITLLVYPTQGI